MSKNLPPLRPGLTAIAAVLALSATPAFAQDTTAAAPQAAPVISAPPAPTPAPAPEAAEAAPAPVQSTATDTSAAPVTTAPAAAPAAAMATQSTPVVHQPDPADTAPVAKAASAPARAKTVSTKTSEIKTAAAAPAPAPVAAPKVAEPAPAPAPVAQAETPAPVALVPVAKTSTTTQTSTTSNDNREIELAGIGGVALLAIIGGAVAFTRRKRDDEDELALTPATVTTSRVIEETPVYEPVTAAPVAAVAAPRADYIDAPTTTLHPDFDLSRYGAHVQMAYQGPTEDNPSLSLRHRLKRARFMDQRARENGEYVAPIAAETSTAKERKPVTQNMISARLKQGLRAVRPQSNMRPAFG